MRKFLTLALALSVTASAASLAFLGPKGTYSDQAATQYAAAHDLTVGTVYPTITAVGQAVVAGETPFGLIPNENSSGAFVAETSGLLAKGDPGWRIIGELTLPISNTLLVKPGTNASDIRTIISHPQPFKQSAGYLAANYPNVTRQEVASTAAAAEAVSKGDGTSAAISAPAAATVYGLSVLAADIQDDKHNATSFWAVQKADQAFPERRPNRVLVMLDTQPGDARLGTVMGDLRALGFAPRNVQSWPLGGRLGGYRFVLAFDSEHGMPLTRVQATLAPLGKAAILLGAYRK
ncbi:prephenate dehydratase [Deinococcus soli (ex Cha et al. 2016)]|uniref:prephenate dehydratase n=1 Tax=Deinococcus soli (ex Cha et al. 2016) TaxID=1309411 RepID=UPI00166C55D4|nr:prephenate dehydratase domain-containing protein [Deinococcus soli (ex Cha et al. 2016)]GGB76442.1 prephenate dehydratase [Deinococcus soli (ex Cha et al. 2016)]